jgi:hypothetical protein
LPKMTATTVLTFWTFRSVIHSALPKDRKWTRLFVGTLLSGGGGAIHGWQPSDYTLTVPFVAVVAALGIVHHRKICCAPQYGGYVPLPPDATRTT